MAQKRTPGDRIIHLRETHRIERAALAERSGLPLDLLTRIEEGAILPDLAPLVKLARALGVRLGSFLDDQEELGPVVTRAGSSQPTVRFAGTAKTGALDFKALASGKSGRHMEPFLIDVLSGTVASAPSSHEGEEFIYVLSGSVAVAYGSERWELGEGDSIYYDSIVPHRVDAAGGGAARILAIVYAPF